jgi:predicted regulator of Ras-like GTPase activity (Roadblock/LC7/MglB family)
MADATLTPDVIEGLSPDIRACVLLDADGRLVAADSSHEEDAEQLAELARGLLEQAGAPQVEVSTGSGVVYALRAGDWSLAAVAGRFALSSLVFFDMRKALEDLAR